MILWHLSQATTVGRYADRCNPSFCCIRGTYMGWQLELVFSDIPQFFPRLPFPKKYAPRRVLCLWQASPKMRKMLGDLTSCSLQSSQYCVQIGKKIMWILASFPLSPRSRPWDPGPTVRSARQFLTATWGRSKRPGKHFCRDVDLVRDAGIASLTLGLHARTASRVHGAGVELELGEMWGGRRLRASYACSASPLGVFIYNFVRVASSAP